MSDGLTRVAEEWRTGSFRVLAGDEDVHSANERRLKAGLQSISLLPAPLQRIPLLRRTKKHTRIGDFVRGIERGGQKRLTVSFPWQELIGLEVGGKLHVGRSRNDQVATDMRLWLRSAILQLKTLMASLISRITSRAEA